MQANVIHVYPPMLFIALFAIVVICVKLRKLTPPAAIFAAVIGAAVYLGSGDHGILLLCTFFILGVLATSYKKKLKPFEGVPAGPRNAGQVFANGGVAAIAGLLAYLDPEHRSIYQLMLAGSLASALADTLSSELGMIYGRRFYNILSLKKEVRGLDGLISLEGTLIGVAGAGLIGLLHAGFSQLAFFIALAGIFGNAMDSVLGASLERKKYLNNDAVNFLNTLLAALAAVTLDLIF